MILLLILDKRDIKECVKLKKIFEVEKKNFDIFYPRLGDQGGPQLGPQVEFQKSPRQFIIYCFAEYAQKIRSQSDQYFSLSASSVTLFGCTPSKLKIPVYHFKKLKFCSSDLSKSHQKCNTVRNRGVLFGVGDEQSIQ